MQTQHVFSLSLSLSLSIKIIREQNVARNACLMSFVFLVFICLPLSTMMAKGLGHKFNWIPINDSIDANSWLPTSNCMAIINCSIDANSWLTTSNFSFADAFWETRPGTLGKKVTSCLSCVSSLSDLCIVVESSLRIMFLPQETESSYQIFFV